VDLLKAELKRLDDERQRISDLILKVESDVVAKYREFKKGRAATPETITRKPRGTRRGRPPKEKAAKPKKPATTPKRTYFANLDHIQSILKEAGEPLTPFKIGEKLLERMNIRVTEKTLAHTLKLGVHRDVLCSPQQGEYALPV
jgi:hypothetical protein